MRRAVWVLLATLAAPALGQPVELSADTEVSDTGYYSLSWTVTGEEGAAVTLQESAAADFSAAATIYEGPDRATVVSGRLDGTYHYRIRAGDGPWSEPLTVTVRHHSLAQAFSFLAMGAVVVVATMVLIIAGHRRHRLEAAAGAARKGAAP